MISQSHLKYSRARSPLHHSYKMAGVEIPHVTQVRDLGVAMVQELTFRKHITEICVKSFRNLGFVLRQCKDFHTTQTARTMYNALVRSYLETSPIVWSPHEEKYKLMLEKLQNKLTRFLYLKEYGVYPFYPLMYPSLFVMGMVGYSRLEVRRELALVVYVWRVLRGELHHPQLLQELKLNAPPSAGRPARRRRPPLAVPSARTDLLKFAYMSRAIKTLNSISNTVDIFNCSRAEFTVVAQKYLELF